MGVVAGGSHEFDVPWAVIDDIPGSIKTDFPMLEHPAISPSTKPLPFHLPMHHRPVVSAMVMAAMILTDTNGD
ncbi:MAG: hypothetical protein ACOC41_00540 [Chitinivibrionales bacterium]